MPKVVANWRRRWIAVCAGLWFGALAGGPATALPTLQLHLPDATYFEEIVAGTGDNAETITESWFTTDNPFDLNVVGARKPSKIDVIEDVRLWIAIQEEDFEDNPGGTVTLRDGDGNEIAPTGPAVYGTPEPLSPHDIYPAYYFEYELADLEVKTAGQDIWDYDDDYDPNDPGDPAGTGDIQNYNVEYTDFVWLHVDLSGIAVDNDGHRTHYWARVAPYSHDADAHGGGSGDEPQTVAEPGGLPLFGLALWLFLLARRRWFASI